MSEDYLGGLVESPSINYTERLKYLNLAREVSKNTGALFLDTVNDKKLYGMVDNQFYIVAPNPEPVSFGDYAADAEGLNYLVTQYNRFREEYNKAVATTALQAPDIVAGLVPKKSYINFEENFKSYQDLVEEVLVDVILRKHHLSHDTILSFSDFLRHYKKAMFDIEMADHKLTRTGYVLSPFSTCFESGLYIDLSPGLSPEIDSVKASLLLDDNFRCYAQTATRHGFYVDLNCPWRLILNLNATPTRKNILNNNMERPFYGFYRSEYLQRVGYGDFWTLQNTLLRAYRKLRLVTHPDVQHLQISSAAGSDIKGWVEIYLLTRFREIGIMSIQDFESADQSSNPGLRRFSEALRYTYDLMSTIGLMNASMDQQSFPLTFRSGVLGYIEELCAKELKDRLMQDHSDPYISETSQNFIYRDSTNPDQESSLEQENS